MNEYHGIGEGGIRTRDTGVTPYDGLANRSDNTATHADATTCGDHAENSADYLALLERKSPDLALLVKRWDKLPEAVRAGIMAMIRASSQADE